MLLNRIDLIKFLITISLCTLAGYSTTSQIANRGSSKFLDIDTGHNVHSINGKQLPCGDIVRIVPGDFIHPDATWQLNRSPEINAKERDTMTWAMEISKGILRAQILTCSWCRRQMGWGLEVNLMTLKNADPKLRQAVQRSLGWPALPLLDIESDWRASVRGKPTSEKPCIGTKKY